MKNKIIITFAVIVFLVPQVTFAAWWNPFTWKFFYSSAGVKTQKTIVAPSTIPSVNDSQKEATNQVPAIKKIKEVPAPINKITPRKKKIEDLGNRSNTAPDFIPSIQQNLVPQAVAPEIKIEKCRAEAKIKTQEWIQGLTEELNKTMLSYVDILEDARLWSQNYKMAEGRAEALKVNEKFYLSCLEK